MALQMAFRVRKSLIMNENTFHQGVIKAIFNLP
jgi:hypothetical protein